MVRSFLLSCAFLVSFAVPLLAQESYREFERGLNLSESQRAQVEGIKRRYMGEWRILRIESARKRFELRELRRFQPDQWERAERVQRELDQIEADETETLQAVPRRGVGSVQRGAKRALQQVHGPGKQTTLLSTPLRESTVRESTLRESSRHESSPLQVP